MLESENFSKAIAAIEHSKNILILPSSPVDGDSLGASLALYDVLKAMDKRATVVLTSDIPDIYKFLPNVSEIHSSAQMYAEFMITLELKDQMLDDIRHEIVDNHVNIIVTPDKGRFSPEQVSFPEPKKHYDLIITVDTADLTQLGEFYKQHFQIFSEVPSINIDHHISNKNYASLNIVDASYCSTTHILYDLFLEMSVDINPDVATLLLAGIITDTGSFQNSNTSPEAFDVASELIDLGGRQQEIIQHIYKTKQLSSLKLWGKILSKIQIDSEYSLMWTSLTSLDLEETETTNQDKGEIMDELLSNAQDAGVVLLLEERPGPVLHGSIRTSDEAFNAIELAEKFGGGGHPRAAGFNIPDATVESHEAKVLKEFRAYIDQVSTSQKSTEGLSPLPSEAAETPDSELDPALETQESTEDDYTPLEPVSAPAPAGIIADQAEPTPETPAAEAEPEVEPEAPSAEAEPEPPTTDTPEPAIAAAPADTEQNPEQTTQEDTEEVPELAPEQNTEEITAQAPASELDADFNESPDANLPPLSNEADATPEDQEAAAEPAEEDQQESTVAQATKDLSDLQSELPPLPDELPPLPNETESSTATDTATQSEESETQLEDELPPLPDELEQAVGEVEEDEVEDQTQDSIDQELVPQALDNPSTEDIDSELVPKGDLQEEEPEQRIKKLSQDFFQKPEEAQTPDPTEDSLLDEDADELAAKAATSEFSEIPSFGEHLDLSKVPEANPATDDLEFPANPFAEDQTPEETTATGDNQPDLDNTNPDNKGPGQLPTPDVPEDL